jgi:cysteinyl-tRNA synthetase
MEMLLDFDEVLGLGLSKVLEMTKNESVPPEVTALAETREEARAAQEWDKADALRKEIETRGYIVKDTDEGFVLKRK